MSTVATFSYVHSGQVWHTGWFETNHTSPQAFADAFREIPLDEPTDEVWVWFGDRDGRGPDAVAQVPA